MAGAWTARERRSAQDRGPGLWALVYGSLWIQISLLAAMVFLPREDPLSRKLLVGTVLGSAVLLIYVVHGWAVFHDFLIGFDLRGRVLLECLLVAACIAAPLFLKYPLLPDALFWAALVTLPIAVTPGMLRRGLALSLLAAWFAARDLPGAWGLALTLTFGAAWLLALGNAHIGFMGEPFALRGWWLPRRALRNMAFVALPSAAAGVLMYLQWQPPQPGVPARSGDPVEEAIRQVPFTEREPVDPQALLNAVFQLAGAFVIVIITLVVLHFLIRKLRGRTSSLLEDLLPGQIGRLHEAPPAPGPARGLAGRRGEIVRLWARWARAQPVAEGRDPADTAREFAGRVGPQEAQMDQPDPARQKQLATELLENAHYNAEEPTEAQVATMRELTAAAIERERAARKQKHK